MPRQASKKVTSEADVLKAVRVQLEQAAEKMQLACKLLRSGGFPENADSLAGDLKRLRVWTQAEGWLSYLEKGGKA